MNDSGVNPGSGRAVDTQAIATRIWYRRRWVAACVILTTLGFTAAAFILTPIYRSAVVFVPASPTRAPLSGLLGSALGSLGGLSSPAGINIGLAAPDSEEAVAVLKSRQFTEAFIEDWHIIGKLFPRKWDAQRERWRAGVTIPTPAEAYKYFDQSVRSVFEDKRTGLITLEIDWRDRADAAAWANELLRRVNAEMRSRAIKKADASIGYLEKELNTTGIVATRDAISRLMEAQINQRMLADVTEEYAFRVVDKAMPADEKDVLRPRKILLVIAGFVLGTLLGIGAVVVVDGVNGKLLVSASRGS